MKNRKRSFAQKRRSKTNMKYQHFAYHDFLNDEAFLRWVSYGEQDAFWQAFMLENPTKQADIQQARDMIRHLRRHEAQQPVLNQQKIWEQIQDTLHQPTQTPVVSRFSWKKWGALAASIALLLGLSFYYYTQRHSQITYEDLVATADTHNLIEQVNSSDHTMKIALEDGSFVTLDAHSKISYPAHFEPSKREVFLSGAGFFDIQKNPKRPFYVYANEVVTKVLGTSFRVQAFAYDKQVYVKVKTGKVAVFKQNQANLNDAEAKGLIVLPNQQAIFSREQATLNKRLVETPLPLHLPVTLAKRRIEDMPVSQVFALMEQLYGVKIIYNEESLSSCIITTTFAQESLYDKLDVICQTIGAKYKEIDAQIIVESEGCQ